MPLRLLIVIPDAYSCFKCLEVRDGHRPRSGGEHFQAASDSREQPINWNLTYMSTPPRAPPLKKSRTMSGSGNQEEEKVELTSTQLDRFSRQNAALGE